jgi:hypothetical protein
MTTYAWILCSLVAFDVLIVTLLFLLRHYHTFLDRRTRVIMGVALSGFVFHAVLFFEGPILIAQLATIAVIYIGLVFWPLTRQSADRERNRDNEPSNA